MFNDKKMLLELRAVRFGLEILIRAQTGEDIDLKGVAQRSLEGEEEAITRSNIVERILAHSRTPKPRLDGVRGRVVEFDSQLEYERELVEELGDDSKAVEFVQAAGIQAYQAWKNGNPLAVELYERFKRGEDITKAQEMEGGRWG